MFECLTETVNCFDIAAQGTSASSQGSSPMSNSQSVQSPGSSTGTNMGSLASSVGGGGGGGGGQANGGAGNGPQQQALQPAQSLQGLGSTSGANHQSCSSFHQYFTPPSQHSGGGTPQHLVHTLDSYPTPSPESPGDWSSSSPHSNSDWSEGVQSPANNVYVTGGHQANKGSEAIYIWSPERDWISFEMRYTCKVISILIFFDYVSVSHLL